MKRLSICLVGAALAAAACGDDSTSSPSDSSSGGGSGTTTSATSTTTSVSTSPSSSSSSDTTSGTGGTGGTGEGGAGGSGGTGGLGGGAPAAPPFREPVDLADEPLAIRALQIVGADIEGAEGGCKPCHALTEGNLTNWNELTNGVLDECLLDLEVTSQESALSMIECVNERNGVPGSKKFATSSLGFWAAGATRDWWRYTFETAYPEDGAARYDDFVAQVKMPPSAHEPLTDEDYDVVGEWFVRGAPLLDELLDEQPAGECDDLLDASLAEYVADRQLSGWRAKNASDGMLMFGCEGDEEAIDCLSGEADAPASWLVAGQGSLKYLAGTDYESSYWTRGSADGRYVGHGAWTGNGGAAMIDLQDDVVIPVDALYDPGFFPDDSGFVFQGGFRNICRMSVLTSGPASISMTEPGCTNVGEVGLYQHVGASLGGGDYFAVDGEFVSDDGGHDTTLSNPEAFFGPNTRVALVPMVFTGSSFDATSTIQIPTPNAGDTVISPSAGLLVSRMRGSGNDHVGYVLDKLDATPDGQGGFDVETTTLARFCYTGGKPAFSYDERWLVFHHYVENTDADAQELGYTDRDDPGFAQFRSNGASNIYLLDLLTGQAQRITNVNPGRYALYPFFRSDGWIYFITRTSKPSDGESVIASDAALLAEAL